MDVDNSIALSKIPLHGRLKVSVPIQNVDRHTVNRVQTRVLGWVQEPPPLGGVSIGRTVDDMGDVVPLDECDREKRPRTNQNTRVEKGRRVAKIGRLKDLRDQRCHLLFFCRMVVNVLQRRGILWNMGVWHAVRMGLVSVGRTSPVDGLSIVCDANATRRRTSMVECGR
jgi:hypothetical protein